jgi:RNA polymerase sigma-70 factor (ECF subfamily)
LASTFRSRPSGLEAALIAHRPALLHFFTARTCDPAEAEAIVQDLAQAVGRTATGPIGDPFGHICRIGLKLVIERARDRQSRAEECPPGGSPLATNKRTEEIAGALASMPPDAAQVFRLQKINGCSQREIADQLGISRKLVEHHMVVAFGHLAKELGR